MHKGNLTVIQLVPHKNIFTILNNKKVTEVHVNFLQMAVNGRRRRSWTPLSLSTSSRAWLLALNIICASPTATPPSLRLTLRQKEQVLWVFCLDSSSFLSSSLLCPLGFYKAWSYRECLAVPCLWSTFKDFCEKRACLAIWNDPLLLFVCGILLCSLVPWWNATLSECIMLSLLP